MNTGRQQHETQNKSTSLHSQAEDNLRFIRASMERASTFTGVSGKGYVIGGCSALLASWLAAQQENPGLWVSVWMLELLLAFSVMLACTALKASSQGSSIRSANFRKLMLAFMPAMLAGGILSVSFYLSGLTSHMPALWLTLYGAAVVTAGAHSVRAVPVLGLLFILTGALAALTPINSDLLLGLGFGGLHIAAGLYIWRHHGG